MCCGAGLVGCGWKVTSPRERSEMSCDRGLRWWGRRRAAGTIREVRSYVWNDCFFISV